MKRSSRFLRLFLNLSDACSRKAAARITSLKRVALQIFAFAFRSVAYGNFNGSRHQIVAAQEQTTSRSVQYKYFTITESESHSLCLSSILRALLSEASLRSRGVAVAEKLVKNIFDEASANHVMLSFSRLSN